jgi:hypothetical protein
VIVVLPAVVFAHHVALLAIPAVAPAVVVCAVILAIIWRDRRDERRERDGEDEDVG